MPRPPIVARRSNWIGITVALAAGLAVAAYLMADRTPTQAIVLPAPVPVPALADPPVATAAAEVIPAPVEPPAPRRVRRVRRPAPEQAYFVALDDEPFESGVIMRVDVKPGNVQADIVFGPDGRAHAFRLVNAAQRNY
jgi:hypothetical protein